MAGTELLNEEAVPHTEKPQKTGGGVKDGLNKKIGRQTSRKQKL